jgi:hypothetical protein
LDVQYGRGGRKEWQQLPPAQYRVIVASSTRLWGFKVDGTGSSLFDDEDGPDLQIGALIETAESNLCFPFSGRSALAVGNPDIVKGNKSRVRPELDQTAE